MTLRFGPAPDTQIVVDGERIAARTGEPIAVSLYAAGRFVLSRSVKYHRPRGAHCLARACEGCLMRVDGRPNVMTCERSATEGATVTTQNVLGSADLDLLRVTDWFFPSGMNHHEMFTQFGPLNRVMQKVARRVAGIGRLPDSVVAAPELEHREVEVLVVGAGPAGLSAATSLAKAGRSVLLVEAGAALGGSLRLFPSMGLGEGHVVSREDLLRQLAHDAEAAGVRRELSACAVTLHREEQVCWVSTPIRSLAIKARAVVIATGCREAMPILEGIDLPRVVTGHGAAVLLQAGVLPGRNIVVAGAGAWADAIASSSAAEGASVRRLGMSELGALRGSSAVESVVTASGEKLPCDVVVIVGTPTAVYELAGQVDASIPFRDDGFVIATDAMGAALGSALPLWGAGSVRGARGLSEALSDGDLVAASVDRWLAEQGAVGVSQ